MCLKQLAPKNSIVALCQKDPQQGYIAYKIVQRMEDGSLYSPFVQSAIEKGVNQIPRIENLSRARVQLAPQDIPISFSVFSNRFYPLAYHLYALKKDAQFVLAELKKALKKVGRHKALKEFIVIPVYFVPQDVLEEGFEEFTGDPSNPHLSSDPDNPPQKVLVVTRYVVTYQNCLKEVKTASLEEALV